jgi:CheY-like chemotaxis protein
MAEKKTILVVDDFTSIRKFVCETLERKGYHTLDAGSGVEAYELLIQNVTAVDLILTDYNMPDCTGHDLLVMVKANAVTAEIPVVFLTTDMSPEKMRQSKDAGLTAWIKKPYRSEAFFSTIQKALNNEN